MFMFEHNGTDCVPHSTLNQSSMIFLDIVYDVDHTAFNSSHAQEHITDLVDRHFGEVHDDVRVVSMRNGSIHASVALHSHSSDHNETLQNVTELATSFMQLPSNFNGNDAALPTTVNLTMYNSNGQHYTQLFEQPVSTVAPTSPPDTTTPEVRIQRTTSMFIKTKKTMTL